MSSNAKIYKKLVRSTLLLGEAQAEITAPQISEFIKSKSELIQAFQAEMPPQISEFVKSKSELIQAFQAEMRPYHAVKIGLDLLNYFEQKGYKFSLNDYLTMAFEIGPIYNDQGYDLGVSYEGTSLESEKSTSYDDLQELFDDYYSCYLSEADFNPFFNSACGLDTVSVFKLEIEDPARVLLLFKEGNATMKELLSYFKWSASRSASSLGW